MKFRNVIQNEWGRDKSKYDAIIPEKIVFTILKKRETKTEKIPMTFPIESNLDKGNSNISQKNILIRSELSKQAQYIIEEIHSYKKK